MKGDAHAGPHDSNPWCLACRRRMRTQSYKRPAWSPRWKCNGCGASCRKLVAWGESRAAPNEGLEARPWCVRCRRVMASCKGTLFICRKCHANASAHTLQCRPRRHIERPLCKYCGHPKAVSGKLGRFACTRCRAQRRALRAEPSKALALLRQISSGLPGYFSADEREDAAQQIMLDILAGRLAPRVPAAATLRAYAREARSPARDRFHFISLSAPVGEGRTLGELLAA